MKPPVLCVYEELHRREPSRCIDGSMLVTQVSTTAFRLPHLTNKMTGILGGTLPQFGAVCEISDIIHVTPILFSLGFLIDPFAYICTFLRRLFFIFLNVKQLYPRGCPGGDHQHAAPSWTDVITSQSAARRKKKELFVRWPRCEVDPEWETYFSFLLPSCACVESDPSRAHTLLLCVEAAFQPSVF